MRGDRRASQHGFSLIELMVTLAVRVLIASIAFAGFRRNERRGQSRRFVSAVHGAITQARNFAIDRQTPVRVDIDATSLTLTAYTPAGPSNPGGPSWELFQRVAMTERREALLLGTEPVCIHGLGTGVQTPAQAVAVAPPADCLAAPQRLRFEPDGTFSDPGGAFSDVPNAGVTLWIGDRSIPGEVEYSIVQVFPGGLIRTLQELR